MAKFEFSLLTKDEAIDIARRYTNFIDKQIPVENAYLFGSYAKGTADKFSDIDVAIVSRHFSGDIFEDRLWLMDQVHHIDSRIEPHPYTLERAKEPMTFFTHEIQRTGIPLL
ncbi:hypothetical protein AGMMS49992_07650 [Clostridia bacterium]|nr:hypothetical protein AGMMS49992_07650 [Clostridia bacterium]